MLFSDSSRFTSVGVIYVYLQKRYVVIWCQCILYKSCIALRIKNTSESDPRYRIPLKLRNFFLGFLCNCFYSCFITARITFNCMCSYSTYSRDIRQRPRKSKYTALKSKYIAQTSKYEVACLARDKKRTWIYEVNVTFELGTDCVKNFYCVDVVVLVCLNSFAVRLESAK